MDSTSLSLICAVDRGNVLDGLRDVARVLQRLEAHAQRLDTGPRADFYRAIVEPMVGTIITWVEAHLDTLTAREAWFLCNQVIPPAAMDRVLASWDTPSQDADDAVLRRLYAHARPHLARLGDKPAHAKTNWRCADQSPDLVLEIGTPALARLLADGLDPMLALTRGDLATLVLMHDLPVLSAAWSAHAPRKNPAYAHWEDKGFHRPARIGHTGANWMTKAMAEGFASAKYDHARKWLERISVDPILYLAALLVWGKRPGTMTVEGRGSDKPHPQWSPILEVLEQDNPTCSAHQKLRTATFLRHAPPVEAILRMDRLPDDPMDLARAAGTTVPHVADQAA